MVRPAGRGRATEAARNSGEGVRGEDACAWRAEEEELVKRKGGWGGGEDRPMEARLRGWQMPGEQGWRPMTQGCSWGLSEGSSSGGVKTKADLAG